METADVGARLGDVPDSVENSKVGVADRKTCGISEMINRRCEGLTSAAVLKWAFEHLLMLVNLEVPEALLDFQYTRGGSRNMNRVDKWTSRATAA